MGNYVYRNNFKTKGKRLYENTTKEERAKDLNNIICPRCKYQNKRIFIEKFGKCHLCGATLDKRYFIRTMLKEVKK